MKSLDSIADSGYWEIETAKLRPIPGLPGIGFFMTQVW
jgi:hypothetical protein